MGSDRNHNKLVQYSIWSSECCYIAAFSNISFFAILYPEKQFELLAAPIIVYNCSNQTAKIRTNSIWTAVSNLAQFFLFCMVTLNITLWHLPCYCCHPSLITALKWKQEPQWEHVEMTTACHGKHPTSPGNARASRLCWGPRSFTICQLREQDFLFDNICIGFPCQGFGGGGYSSGICKKLLEVSSVSSRINASWLQDWPAAGHGRAHQWLW